MARLLGPSRPDWRWTRAVELAQQSQATAAGRLKAEDPAVYAAWSFQRDERHQMGERQPVIHAAHQLFVNNLPLRSQVEALLLAEATDDEVGARCWCDPQVVQVYHDLFFDVREGLHRPSWICATVFGGAAHRGAHHKDAHGLLLRVAWFCGLPMLDEYLSGKGFSVATAKTFRNHIQSNLVRHGLDLSFAPLTSSEDAAVLIQLAADPKENTQVDVDAATKAFRQFTAMIGPSVKLAAVQVDRKVAAPAREPRAHERLQSAQLALTTAVEA